MKTYPSRYKKVNDGRDEWSKLIYINFYPVLFEVRAPRKPSDSEASKIMTHRATILDSSEPFRPLEIYRNFDYSKSNPYRKDIVDCPTWFRAVGTYRNIEWSNLFIHRTVIFEYSDTFRAVGTRALHGVVFGVAVGVN